MLRVLGASGQPMGPQEIADGVLKAGYPTRSKNLARVISNTLPRLHEVKRAGFGKYRI